MIPQRANLASLAALVLASCQPSPHAANQANKTAEHNVVEPPAVLPLPAAPLDRRAILLAVIEAASATAAGTDDRQAQKELDGARFEFPIRFGCGAPLERLSRTASGWAYDEEERTFRVQARSDLSLADPLVPSIAGDAFEAAEGVWLPRPWLLQSACISGRAKAAAPTDESEAAEAPSPAPLWRVGIAQFFTASDSRAQRRLDRPYEAVEKLEEGEAPPAQGFDLVLVGRLRTLGDGRVIHCTGSETAGPPDCIVSVVLDSVMIRRGDNGETLAEWSRT